MQMKKISLVLVLVCVSVFVFGQQQQFNADNQTLYTNKIKHFHSMKSAGQALTFGGTALVVIGLVVLENASNNDSFNNNTNGTSNSGLNGSIAGGLVTYLVGAGCVGAGVPLWIVGGINQGRYERKLDSLSLKIKVNPHSAGLALCYRF
jgi:hypothetical protein